MLPEHKPKFFKVKKPYFFCHYLLVKHISSRLMERFARFVSHMRCCPFQRKNHRSLGARVHGILSVWRKQQSMWTVDKHEQVESRSVSSTLIKGLLCNTLAAQRVASWQAEHDEERQQRVELSVRADSGLRRQGETVSRIYKASCCLHSQ